MHSSILEHTSYSLYNGYTNPKEQFNVANVINQLDLLAINL